MSQSSKTLKEYGSLVLVKNANLKTGSTTSVRVELSPVSITLADAAATLTVAQLQSGILVMTPTAGRTVTMPTPALLTTFLKNIGESFTFSVINLGLDTVHITLAVPSGGTIVGSPIVRDSDPTAASATGSATFKVILTAASTYSVFRL